MRPIHIALTFDDSYWAPAYATMRSICLSIRNRTQLVFHLCHIGLTVGHRAILDEIATEFGAMLHYYDPRQEPAFTAALEHLPIKGKFSAIVYARLFLDRLLPAEVERVLYLDCDIMVRRHLDVLYDTDLAGRALAAVADPYHDGIKLGRDIRDKKSPFDAADPYFNSGVLLIDREALVAADLPEQIAGMKAQGLLDQLYFDQDILNYVFAGNWLELDWRFNLMIPRKPHEGLNPAILHYTGYRHPWEIWSGVAFSRTYRHVMTNRVFWRFWRERQKRRFLGRT